MLVGTWIYESVWIWKLGRWQRARSEGPYYTNLSTFDTCGALNPLGLEPGFFMSPPYRTYHAQRYDSRLGRWVSCANLRNW